MSDAMEDEKPGTQPLEHFPLLAAAIEKYANARPTMIAWQKLTDAINAHCSKLLRPATAGSEGEVDPVERLCAAVRRTLREAVVIDGDSEVTKGATAHISKDRWNGLHHWVAEIERARKAPTPAAAVTRITKEQLVAAFQPIQYGHKLEDFADAALALLSRAAPTVDEWRPISECPKNDYPVDLWFHPESHAEGYRVPDCRWDRGYEAWRTRTHEILSRNLAPTHFMERPNPPIASGLLSATPEAEGECDHKWAKLPAWGESRVFKCDKCQGIKTHYGDPKPSATPAGAE